MGKHLLSAVVLCVGLVGSAAMAGAAEVAGAVDANGTSQVKSTKYTVAHPSTGRYIIRFRQAFPAPYATCLFMPIGNVSPSGLTETTTKCDVTFINSSGKLVNVLFNFLAVDTTD